MFETIFKIVLLATVATAETAFIQNRISGGQSVSIGDAPYLVSIRYKKNINAAFEHRCSGTIYSSKLILTTATCVIGLDSKHLHVKAGSTNRTQTEGYLYLVEKYKVHPDFNIFFTDNDLALVLLAFDLTESNPKEIAPITLINSTPQIGSLSSIAGWGRTDSHVNSNFSEILQVAFVNIISDSECKESYGENRITPAMLCAVGKDTDACLGDAGGALVHENNALGLISWGYGCTSLKFPSVFTNLAYFKEWIENEARDL